MSRLKIATFNVEWMISVFGGEWRNWGGQIPHTFPGKRMGGIKLAQVEDVPGLCRRIAGVIKSVEPGILAIQEGPPLQAQMQLFVRDYLDDEYVVHSSNPRTQTLHVLVHRSIAPQATSLPHDGQETMALRSPMPFYPWGAIKEEERKEHTFDRRPLVLTFEPSTGKRLRIINVHAKSKISKLKSPQQLVSRDEEAIADALLARQKLSAEILALRNFLLKDLRAEQSAPDAYVVLGDFNDGPFRDLFETQFLIHNILDELVGSFLDPSCYLMHAMTPATMMQSSSVSFPDPLEGGRVVEELIDHILISPGIWWRGTPFRLKPNSCKVETGAYGQFDSTGTVRRRGDRPSDHRPVSALIEY